MKKLILFCGMALASYTHVVAQSASHRCGSNEYNAMMMQLDPSFEAAQRNIEAYTQLQNNNLANNVQVAVTIPVVVHVLYNNSIAGSNISDAVIKTQIDVLNEDFAAYNSDIVKVPPFFRNLVGDSDIRFELATRDPNGNVTNGVTRTLTAKTAFQTTLNDAKYATTGGHDIWNRNQYLNLWVVPEILDGSGFPGVLGYGQFPGGAVATDGVVIGFEYFGRVSAGSPYNYGRTATHEVGHWLNLRHIWGDDGTACTGSDMVNDTPNSAGSNGGSVVSAPITCNNGPRGDMFMNYMDYSDDKYLYMFTNGQITRMQAIITGARASLQTSNALTNPAPATVDVGITSIISPALVLFGNTTNIFTPEVVLKNFGTTTLTTCSIVSNVDALTPATFAWTGSLAPGASVNVTLNPVTTAVTAGDRLFYAATTNPNGTTDGNPINDRTGRNFIGKTNTTTLPQSFNTTPFPPAGWSNKNYTAGTTWTRQTTAAHTGAACMAYLNFSNTVNGKMNDMYTAPINLTTLSNPVISFWVAYAPESATVTDTLEILVSTDGGVTQNSVYKKWGSALGTVAAQTAAFTPGTNDWRLETINLSAFATSPDAYLIFRNISATGNNLWVDDLDITTSIGELKSLASLSIYPNPANENITVAASLSKAQDVELYVTDMLGQLVFSRSFKNMSSLTEKINTSAFASGVYQLNLRTAEGMTSKKISIVK